MSGADQADGLRRLLNTGSSRIVAIAGLSPGIGTTTVALNLSVELARQGGQVLLLDEQAAGSRSACKSVTIPFGVRVLPAPREASRNSFNPRTLCPGGFIVVDAALGPTGQLSPLARLADELVIVMQPVASSITATYAGLKRLHYTHALQQFRFLVNNVAGAAQAQRVIANVTNASSRYLAVTLQSVGWISSDALVGQARGSNQTVCEAYPASAAATDFRQAAAAIRQGGASPHRAVATLAGAAGTPPGGTESSPAFTAA
jgi:flagellar biosynthesis protein FlhG